MDRIGQLLLQFFARCWLLFLKIGPIKHQGATVRLDNLIRLSKNTAIKVAEHPPEWRDTAIRTAELTNEAETYCALSIIKDSTEERLKELDYVVSRWRLDFVRPYRFHVRQEMWDSKLGVLFDHWVTIGKETYQTVDLQVPNEKGKRAKKYYIWKQAKNGTRDGLNKGLLVDRYLEIVRNQIPKFYGVYKYLGERFLLLEYDPRGFPEQYANLVELCKEIPKGEWEFDIWIYLDTGYFAKAQVNAQGESKEGKRDELEFHHVFTCYNELIEVKPPQWLNLVPNAEGKSTIVETKIPNVPHHE